MTRAAPLTATAATRPQDRILVALDTEEIAQARRWAAALQGLVGGLKIGKEFFTRHGPEGVRQAVGEAPLFLDLKFHDIPNTVAGALRAALALKPRLVNVHAAGGPAMLRAAAEAVRQAPAPRPLLIAVTVLTSLDDSDLAAVGQQGPVEAQVLRLARLAQDCGADGVVCSPREIAALRAACGPGFALVVPGIRPTWAATDDQKRITTPREAVEAGADWLVIGRPITTAADPAAATRRIGEELEA